MHIGPVQNGKEQQRDWRMVLHSRCEIWEGHPRRDGDGIEEELVASIREHGILVSLIVRPHPAKPGIYQVVAGTRRWRAMAQAIAEGHFERDVKIPVSVEELDDYEAGIAALVENIHRLGTHPANDDEDPAENEEDRSGLTESVRPDRAMTVDAPDYSLRINPAPDDVCVDCEQPTGAGVVGFRNGRALCDACVYIQLPQLGTPLAILSTIRFLGSALREQRPLADGRPFVAMGMDLDPSIASRVDPHPLQERFGMSWQELWGDCEEMALEMRYDLRLIARRLEAEGHDTRCLDDPEWVKAVIEEARERGVDPRRLLEERAKGDTLPE